MPKALSSSPSLNRLRAAAGLIPLIEDGLRTSKITVEKAAVMAAFCHWALHYDDKNSPVVAKLVTDIEDGLKRLHARLSQIEIDIT